MLRSLTVAICVAFSSSAPCGLAYAQRDGAEVITRICQTFERLQANTCVRYKFEATSTGKDEQHYQKGKGVYACNDAENGIFSAEQLIFGEQTTGPWNLYVRSKDLLVRGVGLETDDSGWRCRSHTPVEVQDPKRFTGATESVNYLQWSPFQSCLPLAYVTQRFSRVDLAAAFVVPIESHRLISEKEGMRLFEYVLSQPRRRTKIHLLCDETIGMLPVECERSYFGPATKEFSQRVIRNRIRWGKFASQSNSDREPIFLPTRAEIFGNSPERGEESDSWIEFEWIDPQVWHEEDLDFRQLLDLSPVEWQAKFADLFEQSPARIIGVTK